MSKQLTTGIQRTPIAGFFRGSPLLRAQQLELPLIFGPTPDMNSGQPAGGGLSVIEPPVPDHLEGVPPLQPCDVDENGAVAKNDETQPDRNNDYERNGDVTRSLGLVMDTVISIVLGGLRK